MQKSLKKSISSVWLQSDTYPSVVILHPNTICMKLIIKWLANSDGLSILHYIIEVMFCDKIRIVLSKMSIYFKGHIWSLFQEN